MRELTAKQILYVAHRIDGYPPPQAARLAGYADNGTSMINVSAHRLEHDERIQDLINQMYDAMCSLALDAFKKGEKLSPRAQSLLSEWPGAPVRVQKQIKARMQKRYFEDQIRIIRGCPVPDELANSWIAA